MYFERGEQPKIEQVLDKLEEQNCYLEKYKIRATGPYGDLTEVQSIVNKETFEFAPYTFDEGEPVSTPILEWLERKLNVKLLKNNVINITKNQKNTDFE